MADTDEVKEKESAEDAKAGEKEEVKKPATEQAAEPAGDKKTTKKGILLWIILAVAVLLCAAAGFGLGRLFAGSAKGEPDAASAAAVSEQADDKTTDILDSTANKSQKLWYYDLEPVVANLDEPKVTRYIRVALTLQINPEVDQKKGTAFFEEKKLLLANWVTLYLAGLSTEDTRGEKNLIRIQSQICDMFNERLFPDGRPQIKNVLFREFAIQ